MVVMAVIPFGLVGTIWGHALWDVPMSMFTVVGLLGMTGIIINDSIVLVTTIDEKAKDRGLIPAIIDGAADRLRAVMLTTLTTVLGLAPLLYETSSQAQFLKPTVITLVYGLGLRDGSGAAGGAGADGDAAGSGAAGHGAEARAGDACDGACVAADRGGGAGVAGGDDGLGRLAGRAARRAGRADARAGGRARR